MEDSYVVGITAIPYPDFGVRINIITKQDITYHVTIGDIPIARVQTLQKCPLKHWERWKKWMYCKHLYYVFSFLCKVDYESNKFIPAPTYMYNEVIRLLELAGNVECE